MWHVFLIAGPPEDWAQPTEYLAQCGIPAYHFEPDNMTGMSSIIFVLKDTEVMVATDTLATSKGGRAAFFTTKTLIVPHLKLMISGTGLATFADVWAGMVNTQMLVTGIDVLNDHTPSNLAAIWMRGKEQGLIGDTTTTIYQFGISESTRLVRAFAYRSENDFVSEELPAGVHHKPMCRVSEDYEYPRDFRTMMNEQRTLQRKLRRDSRLYIGGEIMIHHLTQEGIVAYSLGRFDDYERRLKTMLRSKRTF